MSQNLATATPTTTGGREQHPPVQYVAPRTDILETKEGYHLTLDLPGVTKDNLEITVEAGQLSIVGRRDWRNEGEPLYRERRPFDFRRLFELDHSIDTGRISASLENGVLRLDLPKTEAVKPRQIKVN